MRDGNSGTRALGRVLFLVCVAALLILLLPGCVTIADCDTGLKSRRLYAECAWDFGQASR